MFRIESKGDFRKTEDYLRRVSKLNISSVLMRGGQMGVDALRSATPVDSSFTASSWKYSIKREGNGFSLEWTNGHIEDGVPIAIILQYGHGTGTGGYVQGRDYINPALKPVFDKIATDIEKAVKSA